MKTIEIKENRTISSYPENFVDSTTRKKTFKDTEGRDIFSYFTEILPNENGAVLNMPHEDYLNKICLHNYLPPPKNCLYHNLSQTVYVKNLNLFCKLD